MPAARVSDCQTAKIASEEMTRLKCKTMRHPPYSPDLAIADFCLFGALKQELQGIDASDDKELESEILPIFQVIPSDELEKSFNRWIERYQWVTPNAANDYPSSP
jgi:hypothetical protein